MAALGLSRRLRREKSPPWSTQEIAILTDAYAGTLGGIATAAL